MWSSQSRFGEKLLRIASILYLVLGSAMAEAGEPVSRAPAFRGVVGLRVDASDTDRGLYHVRETIPVQAPGAMRLLYPQWETASHAPTAGAADLAGLIVSVDGARVDWVRDPLQPHAFDITAPPGGREVELQLDFTPPPSRDLLRPQMAIVPWTSLVLYPAGWPVSALPVAPNLRLPSGMRGFTSLDPVASTTGDVAYAQVSLERLADAPAYATNLWRQVALSDGARPVRLDVLADGPGFAQPSAADLDGLRRMVAQTFLVFGRAPFRHYDILASLSDQTPADSGGGVEHLEEGENNLPSVFFADQRTQLNNLDLVAHEFVHAWNGRSRQPADLWRPTFNEPQSGSLLWVYEGQTEFWGRVLAARAGIRTPQETLDKLALDAAEVAVRPGRVWKTLADSTNDASYMAGRPEAWRSWQRREDYYPEGVMLWLDVDARLRELTAGRKGLDAFAARFFRSDRPFGEPSLYTFKDVCAGLDAIAHDDWRAFLERHLTTHATAQAMAGLERSGWALGWSPTPTATFLQNEGDNVDLTYSVGLTSSSSGRVSDVLWNGPAFAAGLAPGARILTIDGAPFSPAALRAAVAKSEGSIAMQIEAFGRTRTLSVSYAGGLRYPVLRPIPGRVDRLHALLAAR